MTWVGKTHVGDCRDLMRSMAAAGVTVQCIVTSPPYYGLRDYGHEGQIGLEASPADYIMTLADVFAAAHALLSEDGVLWLNLGDSYSSGGRSAQTVDSMRAVGARAQTNRHGPRTRTSDSDPASGKHANLNGTAVRPPAIDGLGSKQLLGMPWRVALDLQSRGWILRSCIIWHKPNPMPESVTDRPTNSHEYVFLMAKSDRYYFDSAAIAEPAVESRSGNLKRKPASERGIPGTSTNHQAGSVPWEGNTRNTRTVWTIPTQPFAGAHFATFPEALVARCILASTKPGDVVMDCFMGSGTVAKVATDLGREFIGCEINSAYLELHDMRRTTQGMPI